MNALSQALNLLAPAILGLTLTACAPASNSSGVSSAAPTPDQPAQTETVELSSSQACQALASWDRTTNLKITTGLTASCSGFGLWIVRGQVIEIHPDLSVQDATTGLPIVHKNYQLNDCDLSITPNGDVTLDPNGSGVEVTPATAPNDSTNISC